MRVPEGGKASDTPRIGAWIPRSRVRRSPSGGKGLWKIPFIRQPLVEVRYKGVKVGEGRLDLLVHGALVVELKAVDAIYPIHRAQGIAYLKAMGLPLGLLLKSSWQRRACRPGPRSRGPAAVRAARGPGPGAGLRPGAAPVLGPGDQGPTQPAIVMSSPASCVGDSPPGRPRRKRIARESGVRPCWNPTQPAIVTSSPASCVGGLHPALAGAPVPASTSHDPCDEALARTRSRTRPTASASAPALALVLAPVVTLDTISKPQSRVPGRLTSGLVGNDEALGRCG